MLNRKYKYTLAVMILFILALNVVNIGLYERIKAIGDEFGYWGIAAKMVGMNWEDLLAGTKFYSYGYSLFLLPIMLCVKMGLNVATAYRIAIFANAIFLIISLFICKSIIELLYPDTDRMMVLVISFCCTCLNANILEMGMAWTEVYMVMFYWLAIYSFVKYVINDSSKWLIIYIIILNYLVAIHMRNVGILAAGYITLAVYIIVEKEYKKLGRIVAAVVVSAVSGAAIAYLYSYTKKTIYYAVSGDNNTVVSRVGKFSILHNFAGWLDLSTSFAGKIYYVGVATAGMTIIALVVGAINIYIYTAKTEKNPIGLSCSSSCQLF